MGAADRLPNQTPENQIFTIDTVVDVTGQVDSGSDMAWVIASPGAIPTGTIANHGTFYNGVEWPPFYGYPQGNVLSDSVYSDSTLTNGGKLDDNQNFGLDSRDKATGLYNIEAEKVLTYASTEGAHLVGEEEFTLDVAGEAKETVDNIRCVFSTGRDRWLPPFCNVVSAKSALININSAQVSTKGQIRSVAKTDDIPAELNYQIAVTPDANSGSGFAEGTVKTTFAGSIMEARGHGLYWNGQSPGTYYGQPRDDWDLFKDGGGVFMQYLDYMPSAEDSWKDSSEVTGGIKNFQKALNHKSGFKI